LGTRAAAIIFLKNRAAVSITIGGNN